MNYPDFCQLAQQSAAQYLRYLKNHNKGIAEVKVSHIRKQGRNVYLTLLGALSPAGLDSIQLQFCGDLYPTEKIRPVEYRSDDSVLILNPDREIFDMLSDGTCEQASVVSSLLFLVERVGKWYENHTSPLSLPTAPPAVSIPSLQEMAGGTPSEDQYAAVCGVLTSPLSYVWGAPGTGKTRYVLSNCVLSYLREDKKVLLVAPTNNALEQMLSGVIDVLDSVDIPQTCIRRLGIPSRNFQIRFPSVCENHSAEKRLAHLSRRVDQLHEQLESLRLYRSNSRMLSLLTELHNSFLSARDNYRASSVPEDVIRSTRAALDDASQRIRALDQSINELKVWRDSFPGRLTRLFFPGRYSGKMAVLDNASHSQLDAFQDQDFYLLKLDEYASSNSLAESSYQSEFRDLCARFRSLCRSSADPSVSVLSALDSDQIPARLESLMHTIRASCEDLSARISPESPDEEQLLSALKTAETELSLLEKSEEADYEKVRVLAMTIDRFIAFTLSPSSLDFVPSHVFVDEAAYCSLIKGCTLLCLDKPLTLLGDHAQLPPVCEMSDPNFKEASNRPVFLWAQSAIHLESAFSIPFQAMYLEYDEKEAPHFNQLQCFPLSITYRFGPALSHVLADLIYTKDFRSASVKDTSIKFISAPSRPDDFPRTSQAECDAIVSLVKQLTDARVDFVVLTPYKKQISLLHSRLRDPASRRKIMTVHASQGREFHTVILSVVDTTQKFFVNSNIAVGKSVLNTAISRTKSELILVLDSGYWRTQDSQLIGQLLQIASPYT